MASRKKPPPKATRPAKGRTYAETGVDIASGDAIVEHLKRSVPGIGGFSGLYKLPAGYRNPRLVAATDGVGTKLLVAQTARRHESIGIDLVAMVVNDLIVCGAKPLFFLDYFATGNLRPDVAREVLSGIIHGCKLAGCSLIGETAEMPGMYAPGHYDLAGFGVGVVEADAALDGRRVRAGDQLIGLEASGLHSNGFSLARTVLLPTDPRDARSALRRKLYRGGPLTADALLEPTRIYVRTVLDLIKRYEIRTAAHITGGGIAGNLMRVLPPGLAAFVDKDAWETPAVFQTIAERGPVDEAEMFRVFNMGIGFILVVKAEDAEKVMRRAAKLGERPRRIGWVDRAPNKKDPPSVELLRQA